MADDHRRVEERDRESVDDRRAHRRAVSRGREERGQAVRPQGQCDRNDRAAGRRLRVWVVRPLRHAGAVLLVYVAALSHDGVSLRSPDEEEHTLRGSWLEVRRRGLRDEAAVGDVEGWNAHPLFRDGAQRTHADRSNPRCSTIRRFAISGLVLPTGCPACSSSAGVRHANMRGGGEYGESGQGGNAR